MAKYLNPAEQFMRDLVAAYQAQLRRDAWDFWLERLKRWKLAEPVWKLALERVLAQEQSFPAMAAVFDYLKQAESDLGGGRTVGQYSFSRPDNAQRWCTKQFPIESKDAVRANLPIDATDIALQVMRERNGKLEPISGEEEYKYAPENFPASKQEARELFRKGWIESGADSAKCDAWFRAIDSARALPDRILQMSDYDDSDIALGRQRAAQLERLGEYERSRQSAADETDLTGI